MTLAGEWVAWAACRGMVTSPDTDVFFPPEEQQSGTRAESPQQARTREERAKRICCACPVVTECLAFALATGQPDGVWGGLTARERAQLRRARSTPVGQGVGR